MLLPLLFAIASESSSGSTVKNRLCSWTCTAPAAGEEARYNSRSRCIGTEPCARSWSPTSETLSASRCFTSLIVERLCVAPGAPPLGPGRPPCHSRRACAPPGLTGEPHPGPPADAHKRTRRKKDSTVTPKNDPTLQRGYAAVDAAATSARVTTTSKLMSSRLPVSRSTPQSWPARRGVASWLGRHARARGAHLDRTCHTHNWGTPRC